MGWIMLAVEPDESYVGGSALRQTEQVFAGAISLANLTFNVVAVNSVLKLAFWNGDE
jgi:hypothetical protein